MVEEKRRFSIGNLFRRTTPKPSDRKVFNPGIQEKNQSYMITAPIVYHIAHSSVIVRTCTTQLKNEIIRRGYKWEEKFVTKCLDCGNEHDDVVTECSDCQSQNLIKPDKKQLEFAKKFLGKYVNSADQMFIDVLKELEDDLNIMDDAYITSGLKDWIDKNNAGVCFFSPIKHGLLTGKYTEPVKFGDGDFRSQVSGFDDDTIIKKMRKNKLLLEEKFSDHPHPVMKGIIDSLLFDSPTGCVLLGQRNIEQVNSASTLGEMLSQDDVAWIKSLYKSS